LVPNEPELESFNKLWKARLSFWIDQHLTSSVVHLMDGSLGLYKEYVDMVENLTDVDE
jgi:hypothetical protein